MTQLLECEEWPEEDIDMGSANHALIQTRLIRTLPEDKFTIATELSLDVSSPERQNILAHCKISAKHELKPDIALYYAQDFDYIDPAEDIDLVRVEKMPLLCIEVVSPSQSSGLILAKLRAYFAMGAKSCWYVDPNLKLVKVFSSPKQSEPFFEKDELFDSVLDIRLPLNKIFAKRNFLLPTP
jgi:Uma2 family endonuclease